MVAVMFVTSELHVFINDVIPIDSTYHSKCSIYKLCVHHNMKWQYHRYIDYVTCKYLQRYIHVHVCVIFITQA